VPVKGTFLFRMSISYSEHLPPTAEAEAFNASQDF
jgi:hypothetical protein